MGLTRFQRHKNISYKKDSQQNEHSEHEFIPNKTNSKELSDKDFEANYFCISKGSMRA